ncbi:MAG TPA: hypothetical protein VMZ03_05440 [Chitinophagaceae bacterium]|nr:hypothetical protein [Chitinophagaceae bacterium]
MEVHTHTHTARKKWTHYFWEFIMLFLAVFCGFLAENQREHFVEHKREKAFMVTMLSDLQADTAMLKNMHKTFSRVILHIDSLIPLLEQEVLMDSNVVKIYQHQVNLNLFYKCVFADRTINQLKNSGNFRLIRNKNVSDKISAYDGYVRSFVENMQDMYILPQWEKLNNRGTSIFKSSVFRRFMQNIKSAGWDTPIQLPGKPYFISIERMNIQQFINLLQQYAVAVEWFNTNTMTALKSAVILDSTIRKEYHLHDKPLREK